MGPIVGISQRRTALYRLYGTDDLLLYVGTSWKPSQRFSQLRQKLWWPHVVSRQVEWHENRYLAFTAEESAVRNEKPVHNLVYSATYEDYLLIKLLRRTLADASPERVRQILRAAGVEPFEKASDDSD